ncbi:hypothetical protein DL93DRAFT_2156067 [Clavulina sp. PMI_390]|nr:hypothetical protein DL93DRAFT_2156067 [Clavulina sp. PMI_390]
MAADGAKHKVSTANLKESHGSHFAIDIAIYRDSKIPSPFIDPAFGDNLGCCSLQMTLHGRDLKEARRVPIFGFLVALAGVMVIQQRIDDRLVQARQDANAPVLVIPASSAVDDTRSVERFGDCNDGKAAWRVKIRGMKVQLTDFENVAYTAFVVLIVRACQASAADCRVPINEVERLCDGLGVVERRNQTRSGSLRQRLDGYVEIVSGVASGQPRAEWIRRLSLRKRASILKLPHEKLWGQDLQICPCFFYVIAPHSDSTIDRGPLQGAATATVSLLRAIDNAKHTLEAFDSRTSPRVDMGKLESDFFPKLLTAVASPAKEKVLCPFCNKTTGSVNRHIKSIHIPILTLRLFAGQGHNPEEDAMWMAYLLARLTRRSKSDMPSYSYAKMEAERVMLQPFTEPLEMSWVSQYGVEHAEKEIHPCPKCHDIFSRADSRNRHMETCNGTQ